MMIGPDSMVMVTQVTNGNAPLRTIKSNAFVEDWFFARSRRPVPCAVLP